MTGHRGPVPKSIEVGMGAVGEGRGVPRLWELPKDYAPGMRDVGG